jgi:hypothetical protein
MDDAETESARVQENREEAAKLKRMIHEAFPANAYHGKVTNVDGEWTADLDDEETLYRELKGRKWTELSPEFASDHPAEMALLTDQAFAAFLPAWLMRSLDNLEGKNSVREFLVYALSPKRDMVPDTTLFIEGRLKNLNAMQRDTLKALMAEFAITERSEFIRKLAAQAAALIDGIV